MATASEYAEMGSWACSADLQTIYFSAEMCRLLGFPIGGTLPSAETIGGVFPPGDWARIRELFETARRDKKSWDGDFRAILPDGSNRTIRIVGNPVPNESGDVVEFLCAAVDVTERRSQPYGDSESALQKAFDEIQKSETKLRRVIDTIPALVWCNLAEGPNEFLNKGWHEYTGLSPEESHGWGWQAVFHPDDLPPLMKRWGELLVSPEPGEIEARIRRFDGVYRWFLIRVAPFFDDDGKLVRWYGTSTDIEDRKWAGAASQAISSEVLLPELIEKLVRIAVEHAGAERGLLILIRGGEPRIEAEAATGPGVTEIVVRQAAVTASALPQSALNYVIRTQQSVLLNDASADEVYSKDEYVRQKRSRSVLCLPIVRQAKLAGALYLENSQTPGAFTPDLVTVLQLLASQAAISIENAGLYSDLQKAGQNFRLIVDTVPGFLCTMTAQGQVEFVNQGILDYTGWTLDDLADWRPLLHPDERERVVTRWMHSVVTGDPYDIEHRILGADGVYRWFVVRGLPARDAEGRVVRWYILITDIDERKKTHEKLERSEAFLAQGQSISQTGSFGWNVASGEVYWSEELHNILDYDPATRGTLDLVFQRIHPGDRDFVRQALDEATTAKKDFDVEHRLLLPDNRVKHVHVMGRAVGAGDLDFVGAVTDVTAAKKAEEKIRQGENELRQILDLAPQHVYVLGADPGATRIYANQAALDYFGLTLEQWRAHDLRKLFHPDDWERAGGGTQTQVADGLPHEVEIRLRRKDGRYRWFLSRRNPLRDELGHLTRWYTAAVDIEDRKQAEQKLQEENVALREELDKASMFEEIVGTSAPLKSVLSRISKVAPTDSSVLITGETGTGKELVARAIHRRSQRSSGPFVSVNCAVIPRDLIASELFGHEKGAFTGATQRRLGRFELAEKGTIFLDEVGELPAETQIALLRVLQEREFQRIGGSGTIRADVRVIAATNRDLESAIAAGTFRSDLFYRLNVFPIELPPLRKRREDVPLLVSYFLNRYARKAGRHFASVDKKSLDLLQSYAWPGNIRELQNVIERSVIVSESQTFSVDASWLSGRPLASVSSGDVDVQPGLFNRSPAQEKAAIEAALRECGGRVYGPSGAAAKLGIPRTTLESKIKALKINKNRFKGPDPSKEG